MAFFRRKWRGLQYRFLRKFGTPKQLADYLYFLKFNKKINWRKPEDLNQWINWFAFNTDTSEWSCLSDKYAVREYVKECGLEDTLVPILAVWDKPDEIDFSNLPDKFVIKANNGSGDSTIVTDKTKVDVQSIRNYFQQLLSHPFGIDTAEPHYLKIPPKIIVEKLLDPSKQSTLSSSLIDYKVWCINGIPKIIYVALNRTKDRLEITAYTPNWEKNSQSLNFSNYYREYNGEVKKPKHLTTILKCASILAKDFPQVRVDFYEVNDKIYFGEMTFTSDGGRMNYFKKTVLKELGDSIAEKYLIP